MMTALIALTACGEGHLQMPAFASRADSSPDAIAGGGTTAFVERDVEAPEVFQVTEAGLWDGRPSLGGIWVAHPDVGDPERVIIRNSDNGQFVIGALFRRERESPGPRLQVSSDAADALGLLAGAPTQLNVTALRSEAQPAETPASFESPAPQTGELKAPDSVEITALESTSASIAPPPAGPSAAAAAPLAATPIAAVQSAAISPAPAPVAPQTTRVDPIASAAAALEAISAALPAATAVAVPAIAATAATPTVTAIPASAPAAATAPIVAPPAPAPVSAPAPAPEPVTATPEPPAPAPTATRAPVTPSPSGDLSKPYIQIGIFSVEENAINTADAMRGAGIAPIMLEGQSQGRRFWRVIVGPANSEADRADMLQTVKAEGFPDAYAVTN